MVFSHKNVKYSLHDEKYINKLVKYSILAGNHNFKKWRFICF